LAYVAPTPRIDPLSPRPETPYLHWTHRGLDLREVFLLEPEARSEQLWRHTRQYLMEESPGYRQLFQEAGAPELDGLHRLPARDALPEPTDDRFVCVSAHDDLTIFPARGPKRAIPWGHQTPRRPPERFSTPLSADLREEGYLNAVRSLGWKRSPNATLVHLEVLESDHRQLALVPELNGHRLALLPLYEDHHFKNFLLFLAANDARAASRVTTVMGEAYYLLALTAFMRKSDFDTTRLAVSSLTLGGHHLPDSRVAALASAWGCEVRRSRLCPAFEQRTALVECRGCSGYHVSPFVHPEVVELDSGRPRERGVGELLLSDFVPFALRQPLLRFRTGCLVERAGDCAETRLPSLRWAGYRADLVTTAGDRTPQAMEELLPAHELREALEPLQWVRRLQPRADLHALTGDSNWMPVWDWSIERGRGGERRLRIQAESALTELEGEARRQQAAELRRAVVGLRPWIAREIDAGTLQLSTDCVPRGALGLGYWV
jgi:hypothetical protein